MAALSPRYQIGVALALAVVAVAVCVHIGMVFLHVAPSNTLTKTHGKAIDEWIYPEFEQNWKLFAPNPLQQNVAVQVRARIRTADGDFRTTGWFDLSAEDGRAIDGNLLPSHTQQNELRRAWDFYSTTHSGENRTAASRGLLAETYLRQHRRPAPAPERKAAGPGRCPRTRPGPLPHHPGAPAQSGSERADLAETGGPGAALVDECRRTSPGEVAEVNRLRPRRSSGAIARATESSPRSVPDRGGPHWLRSDLAAVPAARVPAPRGAVRPGRPVELDPQPRS
ncbi:hypothetical protein SGLAM104S_02042 [Streptomyces glaucescens]